MHFVIIVIMLFKVLLTADVSLGFTLSFMIPLTVAEYISLKGIRRQVTRVLCRRGRRRKRRKRRKRRRRRSGRRRKRERESGKLENFCCWQPVEAGS